MSVEETIESVTSKVANTEKVKHRLEIDLEDIQLDYERVHAAAAINEQRARNFDKVTETFKIRYIPNFSIRDKPFHILIIVR